MKRKPSRKSSPTNDTAQVLWTFVVALGVAASALAHLQRAPAPLSAQLTVAPAQDRLPAEQPPTPAFALR
jgi:hypothetical protein